MCDAAYYSARRAKITVRVRERNRLLRRELIEAYGGKCACCGESRFEFLALDHVNGGGQRHRRTRKHGGTSKSLVAIQLLVKREGYPKDGRYQLLCHNCNSAKGFYGSCPHTRELSLYETSSTYGDRSGMSCDISGRSDWFIQ